jgi:lysophospholipase L1-like esterase
VRQTQRVVSFERYVAIGDSTTEGLADPDGHGGYRGWADRLAQYIADGQAGPLEYANLAVRGLRLNEIRNTQFDDALALKPDLMTVFGGVNDVLGFGCDYDDLAADLAAIFGEARANDITVATFTMPDPTAINPFGRRLRDRMFRLNDLIRAEANRYDVLVLDLQAYPMSGDPRLWHEDGLHGNALGHERVARGLAWRLGIPGHDESWAEPLPPPGSAAAKRQLSGELDWAMNHFAPWLGKGIRGIPHGDGIVAKRPVPTLIPRTEATSAARRD